MLQPRICLLGVLPFRPIIRIGCRATPAECGLDRQAARARQIGGARTTRLHGSVVLWLGARLLRDIGGVTNQRQQQPVRIVRVSMLDLRCVALYCVLRSRPADGCYRCSSMSLCRNRFGIDGCSVSCVDKLDGLVDTAFYERMSNQWREEQNRCQREIERHRNADKSYKDEGVALLDLARNAQRLFAMQEPREKRRLLNFVLSNCSWEDGEVVATFVCNSNLIAFAKINPTYHPSLREYSPCL